MHEPQYDSSELARWLRRTLTRDDFGAPSGTELGELRRLAVEEKFPSGAELFRQGEPPHGAFIVERGEVEVVHETRFDRTVIEIVRAGASVGDLAVLLEAPYPYTARARTATTTLALRLAAVRELAETHPDVCFRWLRLVAHRLERAHRRLVELAGKSAREQLVHLLLHEAEDVGSSSVTLTQKDIAGLLALSRQTVSRLLSDLERRGLIERRRGEIAIRDFDRLREQLPR